MAIRIVGKEKKMYRVTVTTRVLNDKDTLRLSAPILIWLVIWCNVYSGYLVSCITNVS